MPRITVFGEVLFDCFPGGEQVLGGAPFNVAWHLQAFGQRPRFVSRVGEDEAGRRIRRAMSDWGMDTDDLQRDPRHATGQVQITFSGGEPTYDIVDRVAYDFIDADALEPDRGHMLYHGSLGLRSEVSRGALQRLRTGSSKVFMDVNLRDPWWRRDEVLAWVEQADWIKLNEAELRELHTGDGDLAARAGGFLQAHRLEGLVVTRGEKGAMLLMRGQTPVEVAPVAALQVVDTVGAGDALASVLLTGLNRQWPMRTTLERAQQFASAVVGRRGATIDDPDFYRSFLGAWDLA